MRVRIVKRYGDPPVLIHYVRWHRCGPDVAALVVATDCRHREWSVIPASGSQRYVSVAAHDVRYDKGKTLDCRGLEFEVWPESPDERRFLYKDRAFIPRRDKYGLTVYLVPRIPVKDDPEVLYGDVPGG